MYFEFTDSEVAQCHWQDGRLELRFSAAQLFDPQEQEVVWAPLLMSAQEVEPWEPMEPGAYIGRLRGGHVLHASQRIQRLPVPCELQGVITLELEFAQGSVVHARCGGLSLHPLQGASVGAYQC